MGVVSFLLTPWAVPLEESGERHLYAATSGTYAPKGRQEDCAVVGSAGVKGSGAYLLNWDGEPTGKKILSQYREKGVREKVWEHTMEVFEQICGEGGGRYEG